MKHIAIAALAATIIVACGEDAPRFLSGQTGGANASGDGGTLDTSNPTESGTAGMRGEVAGAAGTATISDAGSGGTSPEASGGTGTDAAASGALGVAGDGPGGGEGTASGAAGAAGAASADVECETGTVVDDCMPHACFVSTCVEGHCQYTVDEGSACGAGSTKLCNAAGKCVDCIRDEQCPADGPCWMGDCTPEGTCTQKPADKGQSCEDGLYCNGAEQCDGKGTCNPGTVQCKTSSPPLVCDETNDRCVGCTESSQCPSTLPQCNDAQTCVCTSDVQCGAPTDCSIPRCMGGTCTTEHVPSGTLVGPQTQGDCQSYRCDGNGNRVLVEDDADLPSDDGGGCTRPACSGGARSSVPRTAGTACGAAATDCSGQDTCDGSGNCRRNDYASGYPIQNATAQNCLRLTCDGSGNVVEEEVHTVCRGYGGMHGVCAGGNCYECLEDSDCGTNRGCNAGRCCAGCDCNDEACRRNYNDLCNRSEC